MNSLTLQCGVTLQLLPVKRTVLQNILLEFGDMGAVMKNPALIYQLTGSQQMKALAATERLFIYCAGWGVANEPPAQADEELLLVLSGGSDGPHIRRANWIRYVLIDGQAEMSSLIGKVMALTFKDETAVEDEKEQRIRELEQQLAAMRNPQTNADMVPIISAASEIAALKNENRHAPAQTAVSKRGSQLVQEPHQGE